MKIGFIGLGRMGFNMCQKLLEKNHKLVVYDLNTKAVKDLEKKGAEGAKDILDLCSKLTGKKVIWIMVSAGEPVDDTIAKLAPCIKKGDIIIDGGNSFYQDSIVRYMVLKKRGVSFLDCGTSGGVSGARHGACMMIGGDNKAFKQIESLFKDMCVPDGYGYMGKCGAGHFVKMVHNGIEYGMLGAIGEGFEAVKKHSKKFGTNMDEVVKVYSHGSIIESRLMSWLEDAMKDKKYWKSVSCEVPKGETEEEMKKLEGLAQMPVLHIARMSRVASRGKGYCGQVVSAVRNQFGGHKVKKK